MVTAFVLMKVERGRVQELAGRLADVTGVSEVYWVTGRHDLMAVVRTTTNEEMAEVITGKLQTMDHIRSTEILTTFRAFSRHDLEAMFTVGA